MTEPRYTPDALRAMLAAATPGPWEVGSWEVHVNPEGGFPERYVSWELCDATEALFGGAETDVERAQKDLALIAAAPTALRLLLDVAEAAKAVVADSIPATGLEATGQRNISADTFSALRAALAALEE